MKQGKPRLVRRDEVDIEKFGLATTPSILPSATRYERIKATLCLPVLRDGNVMAILNIENQRDSLARGQDSYEVIHLLGHHFPDCCTGSIHVMCCATRRSSTD